MASPTVLAPFPVLSQAFSALGQPSLASLSSTSGASPSASRAAKRVVKLQLPGSAADVGGQQQQQQQQQQQRGQQELQMLRRSLMILLTPPQTFPLAAAASTSTGSAGVVDGGLAPPQQPALPASLQQLYAAVRSLTNASGGADIWDAVRLAVERGAGSLGGAIRASAPVVVDVRADVGDAAFWLGVVLRGWSWWKAVTVSRRLSSLRGAG
jgi:hypothetical protein